MEGGGDGIDCDGGVTPYDEGGSGCRCDIDTGSGDDAGDGDGTIDEVKPPVAVVVAVVVVFRVDS